MLFLRLQDPMPLVDFLNDDARFENSIHEEFFEVVQAVDEMPTTTWTRTETTRRRPSSRCREKLKAFRDVLQVLKDRNDSDDSAVTAIRRVQDAIRHEARQGGSLQTSSSALEAAAAAAMAAAIDSSESALGSLGGLPPSGAMSYHATATVDGANGGMQLPVQVPGQSGHRLPRRHLAPAAHMLL
ncbi:hypothetical protein PINS_up016773 [Pythium insidiosum]|nr:hypothetical protein PINS_up016773 [Pythium insidiosum]